MFCSIDIVLSNFSFSKPIESLQIFTSVASFCHESGSIRSMSPLMTSANYCLAKLDEICSWLCGTEIILLLILWPSPWCFKASLWKQVLCFYLVLHHLVRSIDPEWQAIKSLKTYYNLENYSSAVTQQKIHSSWCNKD